MKLYRFFNSQRQRERKKPEKTVIIVNLMLKKWRYTYFFIYKDKERDKSGQKKNCRYSEFDIIRSVVIQSLNCMCLSPPSTLFIHKGVSMMHHKDWLSDRNFGREANNRAWHSEISTQAHSRQSKSVVLRLSQSPWNLCMQLFIMPVA